MRVPGRPSQIAVPAVSALVPHLGPDVPSRGVFHPNGKGPARPPAAAELNRVGAQLHQQDHLITSRAVPQIVPHRRAHVPDLVGATRVARLPPPVRAGLLQTEDYARAILSARPDRDNLGRRYWSEYSCGLS